MARDPDLELPVLRGCQDPASDLAAARVVAEHVQVAGGEHRVALEDDPSGLVELPPEEEVGPQRQVGGPVGPEATGQIEKLFGAVAPEVLCQVGRADDITVARAVGPLAAARFLACVDLLAFA